MTEMSVRRPIFTRLTSQAARVHTRRIGILARPSGNAQWQSPNTGQSSVHPTSAALGRGRSRASTVGALTDRDVDAILDALDTRLVVRHSRHVDRRRRRSRGLPSASAARRIARLQPLAQRLRRRVAADDRRVERHRERPAGRRSRRRRAQLAHRPGLHRSALGLHVPARARSPATRRQHELREHVLRLRPPAGVDEGARSRDCGSSTRKATPRRAFRGRAIATSGPAIRASCPARSTRSCARIPATGRKALYLGRRFGAYVPGLTLAESEALLDELWAECGAARGRLDAAVAGRRPHHLGQPLHDASPRRVHGAGAAPHAPADDDRRAPGADDAGAGLAAAGIGAPVDARAPRRLADIVYEQLFRLIARGEFPEGTQASAGGRRSRTRFGVSRPVIRDALARLKDEGYVRSQRGSGNVVLRGEAPGALAYPPIRSISDLMRSYEFRMTVEAATASLAAERRSASDLADLERTLARAADELDHGVLPPARRPQLRVPPRGGACDAQRRSTCKTVEMIPNFVGVDRLDLTAFGGDDLPERTQRIHDEHVAIFEAIRRREPRAGASPRCSATSPLRATSCSSGTHSRAPGRAVAATS